MELSRRWYAEAVRPRLTYRWRRIALWLYHRTPVAVVHWGVQLVRNAYEEIERSGHTAPGIVSMSVGAVRFQLSIVGDRPSVQRMYQELAMTHAVYEPVMLACLTRILKKTAQPRFMDIGAYMGYYACYVAELLGDGHPVYAVESNPIYADAVRESARLNQSHHLRVYHAALSDRASPVGIEADAVLAEPATSQTMISTTLDDLCRREHLQPTVVKMDVHGAEGKVVLGMRSVLATVEFLLLELHPLGWLKTYSPGVTRDQILDTLEACGLTVFYVSGHRRTHADRFQEFLNTDTFSYMRLDRQTRELLLFDRREDIFLLASRSDDIESLLGPSSPTDELQSTLPEDTRASLCKS